ncbi:type I polyketide synthase, partial [Actinoplanes sp. NPDC049265]|uniref:type I polyketide synthase n=1 Tax=Actinoplanes sp. NPDC049265 TaxID=3363902 RepID=UPI00371FA40A
MDLPTYAFQRSRYWLEPASGAADMRSVGLGPAGHPLLGAAVELASGDGLVLTGRLSPATQPWLTDHMVAGTVLLPATVFVELAVAAGHRTGCPRLAELTQQAPMAIPADGAVQVQVTVGGPDADGQRAVEIHARFEGDRAGWTQHARGLLAPSSPAEPDALTVWPPEGAVAAGVSEVYEDLTAAGYEYGPAFRGLRAAWMRGDEVFAEVALPGETAGATAGFGMHPVLLDAALHAARLAGQPAAGADEILMPFAWGDVTVHRAGAAELRVRLRAGGAGQLSLEAADVTGLPVLSVASLVMRPVAPEQLMAARPGLHDALFTTDWIQLSPERSAGIRAAVAGAGREWMAAGLAVAGAEVTAYPDLADLAAAVRAGAPAPDVVLVRAGVAADDGDLAVAASRAAGQALGLVQEWLGLAELGQSRLVMVTVGAMAAYPDEGVADLPGAACWGLMRSAQAENPGRIVLADLPGGVADDHVGAARATAVLADLLGTDEPELAVRDRNGYGRRIVRPASAPPASVTRRAPGTVLITGGTGTLGALTARHLAATGRARHLLLVSRSGPAAPGAAALAAELAAAGTPVRIVACDIADRPALAETISRIPSGTPLTSVIHTAGVIDDGVIGSLTPARIDAVMRGKADGAWNLHRLTAAADLNDFILFSSGAAAFGAGGQGNYAAANAFLDALAARRHADGLTATSLAWGAWVAGTGIGRNLSPRLLDRIARSGIGDLTAEEGLSLLDTALEMDEALIIPARLDIPGLRIQAARGTEIPSLLRGIVGGSARPGATPNAGEGAGEALRRRLAGMTEAGQERLLVDLVRARAAAVLGHASDEAVEPGRPFRALGIDSLTAVELRNRLATATGLRLPATAVFDYPAPAVLGRFLRDELAGSLARVPVAPAPTVVAADEPVAIVGMGCRFPGGVSDPEGLWELLESGTDAVGPVPGDRGWDLEGLFDPDPDHAGTSYARAGGFVAEAAEFDAGFFGISPREALGMDPQQRLLLEVSWEALERAGIDSESLRGSPTGVFAGVSGWWGYGAGSESTDGHVVMGTAASVLSGRVSYVLGLEGPAMTIDTACSSSLVAMHLAAQALRAGECNLALAGGVTVMASPVGLVEFSRQRGLAPDGRCKAFGAGADGMGMAEGAGVLVLMRLSDAQRAGHRVLAVIRGSAVNQDGASNGLTAPNGPSQQRVIAAALAAARLKSSDVDVVEAHGTGTRLGDPIEAQALLATYGQGRVDGEPLWLGSVKSNIGHTQAAAGVAGVMKMVLAMRHEVLPRTLHAGEPSPHVDWSAGDVRLLSEAVSWPAGNGRLRRAGVSSFGISGTNAHLVLEEAPAFEEATVAGQALVAGGPVVWPVSGRDAAGLAGQAERLREFVGVRPELDPVDVGFSLATTRAALAHRAAVVGADRGELLAGLAAVGQHAAGVAGVDGLTVLVFPGQGSQWAGMGRELRSVSPVFAAAFDQVCGILGGLLDLPVADVVLGRDEARLSETVFAQAGLFAVGVALARLLEASGVVPDVVLGHSVGEIAAVHVAGMLSLEDACGLVAARGRLMQGLPAGGAMAAVAAGEAEVVASLERFGGRVVVAAVNGPSAVTVSGEADAVEQVVAWWRELGRKATLLSTSRAFHSPAMDPVMESLERVAAGLSYHEPRVTVVSTLTGAVASVEDFGAPGYWAAQARQPVRFADAIAAAAALGGRVFVEAGPDGALTTLGPDCVRGGVFVAVQRRNRPAAGQFLTALADAFVAGIPVDWARVTGPAKRVELPTYAFQRSRYWLRSAPAAVVGGSAGEARFWAAVEDGDEGELAAALGAGRGEVRAVLPGLAAWRRRDRQAAVADEWRYRVDWEPVPALRAAALAGTWLVVLPDAVPGEAFRAVTAALARHGAQVAAVTAASADREQLSTLLRDASPGAGTDAVTGVVSLLALEDGSGSAGGVAGTLALVQALGDAGMSAPMWAVTSGAVAAGPDEVPGSAMGAQVWALGRVAALEVPQLWGGLVDLPAVVDERAARRLCQVLAGTGEDQVAVRGSGVLARRLVRAPGLSVGTSASAGSWRARGTVLVTGGTGALGGHAAEWLARQGAEHTLLISRSGPAAPGVAVLAARIAAAGASVTVTVCDAVRRPELAEVIAGIAADQPLTAVVHAAGTLDDGVIDGLTQARVDAVLESKAVAASHLHELTAGLDLDAFVLFSSTAATFGSPGQGNYAAANAFLDVLAQQRHARGLSATSVAWGSWAGGGMSSGTAGERLARHGVRGMDPDLALAALGQALSRGETSLIVADIDWEQFAPAFTAGRPSPLLKNLPEAGQAVSAADTGSGPGAAGLAGQLVGLPPAGQEALLVDLVRAQAAAVLGHGSPEAVGQGRPFRDLGFDSLTAVELRNRLATVTGLRLPATAIFDYPAPAVLGRYLQGELVGGPGAAAPVSAAAVAADEPIAIVGMGCRFPGGVGSPEELWGLLAEGGDAVGPFPDDRGWDLEGLFDSDPDHPGTTYARAGGFVTEAAEFDAGFFGISPREAVGMDPQQRLLLEVSWEALERAGIDPESLRGTPAGVFAGAAGYGYAAGVEGHGLTGIATSVLSGRVSYVLGLEGPAITVDTACSSSLVAMHLAAQALRSGECDLALAGGVTVMATPITFVEFSRQRGLAPDGRCKAFGADADGTGWAEGAGMLVLMRLSDAQRAGHRVLAVIRGSAVNQDGASNGLTAPNGPSQQRVITSALAAARLTPADVDAVEAHGTGTRLGDPIEAQALLATYGQGRPEGRPVWLGSVKSNIGHTQAAAGVAGVMKMVLAMRHGVLPATLHVD